MLSCMRFRGLTEVESIPNIFDAGRCELCAHEAEQPVGRGSCGSTSSAHSKRVDFCLIDPRDHAPSATECSIVEEQEGDSNRTPLLLGSVKKGDSDGDHYVGEKLEESTAHHERATADALNHPESESGGDGVRSSVAAGENPGHEVGHAQTLFEDDRKL